uniref:Dynein axonemal intermediate chain 7 n=1 Tax=Sphenodon punctatus TaxID=8508 RepID=A0A8D0LCV6_SPHPU
LEDSYVSANNWKNKFRVNAKWEHYTDCNGSPDPMIPQEINTFMSLWREKRNEDIKLVMENGKHVLMLIEKLEYQLLDMPVLELCEKEVVQYQDSIMELRSLLHQKYNEATEDLLKVNGLCYCLSSVRRVTMREIVQQTILVENFSQYTFTISHYHLLHTVDLRQYTPVGGVYHVDALKLPPQARHIKETAPHGKLFFVIYFEEPLVARWHSEGKLWRIDGITDVKYKMKDKEVYFKMAAFYTITLLQDAHLNMPYQSWELRPNGTDEALLTVLTAFTEVQIQIKETELLSHLRGKWMTPLGLTIALKTAGINIFPAEYSHKYVSVNKKLPATELAAYQQIALVASAFAFGWSKWNLECGEDRVIFKVSEHLKEGPVQDEDWSLYMFNSQRAQRLRITEHSEAFSEDLAERTEFHSTLFHMIKDFATEAAVEKVKCTHYLFIDAVFQLLFAIRVLTYS